MNGVLTMYTKRVKNINEMKRIAGCMGKILRPGSVLSIVGDLGAGKTTFTQFLGESLGIEEAITSPTFSLIHSYDSGRLNHLDLYRLESPEEIETIDFEEYFYPTGITVIEWASRAEDYLPRNIIKLYIDKVDENSRDLRIEGNNFWEKNFIKELENEGS